MPGKVAIQIIFTIKLKAKLRLLKCSFPLKDSAFAVALDPYLQNAASSPSLKKLVRGNNRKEERRKLKKRKKLDRYLRGEIADIINSEGQRSTCS